MSALQAEDSNLDETLFALTSKLPTPPPRPASIASSRSSRRSSVASSLARQSRHFESESNDPPPTPSLAGVYGIKHGGGANNDGRPPLPHLNGSYRAATGAAMPVEAHTKLPSPAPDRQSASSVASTSYAMAKAGSNAGSSARSNKPQHRIPPPSDSLSSSAARRKSKREGPSIVIGVKPSSSPQSTDASLLSPSILERTLSQSSHQSDVSSRPVRPARMRPPLDAVRTGGRTTVSALPSSLFTRSLRRTYRFLYDVLRACVLLTTLVAWPLAVGAMRMLFASAGRQGEGVGKLEAGQKEKAATSAAAASAERESSPNDSTFAERFKYQVCSSMLLGNSLAISSYDAPKAKSVSTEEATRTVVYDERPTSRAEERLICGLVSDDVVDLAPLTSKADLALTRSAVSLLRAAALSPLLLSPFTLSLDVWLRSVVCIASLVFAVVALTGVRTCEMVQYDVTKTAAGEYLLSSYDEVLRTSLTSEEMGVLQREKVKEAICERVTGLIEESKRFDIACNRALSLIQETELVSRGFKLSHPLPPISRIEAASGSPPRLRNGSVLPSRSPQVHSPNLPSGSRSSWERKSTSIIGQLGGGGEKDSLRLVGLRKQLLSSFEAVQKESQSTFDELSPLVDSSEMEVLREMYELEQLPASESVLPELTSAYSSLQRGSWASRNMAAASDSTRRSSASPTVDEPLSSPGTPMNRGSVLLDGGANLERYGSLRKRNSGTWDQTVSVRPTSRLSYISDKSPVGVTFSGPNHNGALKRLSYSSNGSATAVGSLSYRSSLQPAPRIVSQNRRQSGMFVGSPAPPVVAVEEEQPRSPEQAGASNALHGQSSAEDGLKIVDLKNSFEAMHRLRKKVLVCLLAMDFSLQPQVAVESSPIKSSAQYWHSIDKAMSKLSASLGSRAHATKQEVQREAGAKPIVTTAGHVGDQTDTTDYSGFEDRLVAMGQALRTVQIKMQLCATDLRMREPPTLHGDDPDSSSSDQGKDGGGKVTAYGSGETVGVHQRNPELMFSSIREDLLTLSAEWESALKIMRVNQLAQQKNNEPSATSEKAVNGTFDSPQEADEDAMREWVKSHSTKTGAIGDLSTDTDLDAEVRQMIERGITPWSNDGGAKGPVTLNGGPDESSDSDKKVEEDLSTLLIRSANPEHLPAPGLEMVYEDVAVPHARLNRRSGLSRDERIKLVRESRVDSEAAKRISTAVDVQRGMMVELQSVMQNRRSMLDDDGKPGAGRMDPAPLTSRQVLGVRSSNVDVKGQTEKVATKQADQPRAAAAAVPISHGHTSTRTSFSRVPVVRGSLTYRGRLSSPLELANQAESGLPYAQ